MSEEKNEVPSALKVNGSADYLAELESVHDELADIKGDMRVIALLVFDAMKVFGISPETLASADLSAQLPSLIQDVITKAMSGELSSSFRNAGALLPLVAKYRYLYEDQLTEATDGPAE